MMEEIDLDAELGAEPPEQEDQEDSEENAFLEQDLEDACGLLAKCQIVLNFMGSERLSGKQPLTRDRKTMLDVAKEIRHFLDEVDPNGLVTSERE